MTSLVQLINKVDSIELSDNDIKYMCKNKVNAITYPVLEDIYTRNGSILELFSPETNNCVALLQRTKIGDHWVALLFKPERREIEYFDSYGGVPDFAPDTTCKRMQPYLSLLLNGSGCIISPNMTQLQSYKRGHAACGRYVAVRCIYHLLSNSEFVKLMKQKPNISCPDDLVSLMTLTSITN